jgi:dienelactone hydrolase
MAKISAFPGFVEKLGAAVQAGRTKFPNVTGWGALGLCWGGKVTVLFSGPSSVLKASAQVHPGWVVPSSCVFSLGFVPRRKDVFWSVVNRMLAVADAEQLSIPHMVLASNGEDAEIVKQYKAVIDGDGKTGEVRIPMLSLNSCLSKV